HAALGCAEQQGADLVLGKEDRRHGDRIGQPYQTHGNRQVGPDADGEEGREQHLHGYRQHGDEESAGHGPGHAVTGDMPELRVMQDSPQKTQGSGTFDPFGRRHEALQYLTWHRMQSGWQLKGDYAPNRLPALLPGGGLRKLDLTHGRATESALPDCRPVAAARLVGPAGIVAGGDGVAAGPARLAPAPAALSAALCCWPVLGLFPSSPATGRAAAGRTGWQPYGSDRAHSRIATAYRHRLALRDRAGA